MKVSITENSKKSISAFELPIAKQIVKDCKLDDLTTEKYCLCAARYIGYEKSDCVVNVFDCNAEIVKDSSLHDRFFEGSGQIGVSLTFTAEYYNHFAKIYCLLTDVWDAGDDDCGIYNASVRWFSA